MNMPRHCRPDRDDADRLRKKFYALAKSVLV